MIELHASTIDPDKELTWDTQAANICGSCPIAKPPKVKIPFALFQAWVDLAREVDTEWFAFLLGDVETLEVTDCYFPDQELPTGGHCEPTRDAERRPGTIGSVHSHHRMKAFFSEEDTAHMNWPVEIVLNADGEIKANIRHRLECGRFQRVDVDVDILGRPNWAEAYRAQLTTVLTAAQTAAKAAEEQKKADLAKLPSHYGGFTHTPFGSGGNGGNNGNGNGTGKTGRRKKKGSKHWGWWAKTADSPPRKGPPPNGGPTDGENLVLPLDFDKPKPLPRMGVPAKKWDTSLSYWYCPNCDDVYAAEKDAQWIVCPKCKQGCTFDPDLNDANMELAEWSGRL